MIEKYKVLNYAIVHRKRSDCLPIDRSSQWGNPFHLSDPTNLRLREECVAKYRAWLWEQIQSGNTKMLDDLISKRKAHGGVLALGCWCAPRLCHGDVLAAAADWWESRGQSVRNNH
jgi:hypothetical protein